MPMFKKDQLVKCIVTGSNHIKGQIYTVINPSTFKDKYSDYNLLIRTNAGMAYQWRFVPFIERKPEEWL